MILLDLLRSRNTINRRRRSRQKPAVPGAFGRVVAGADHPAEPKRRGTASGAAALAWRAGGRRGLFGPVPAGAAVGYAGSGDYHRRWQDLVAGSAEAEG